MSVYDLPSVVTLEEAKQYLRVTHTFEDDVIWRCCTASYDYIAKFLNTPDFMNGDSPLSYPESIRQAALYLIESYYSNRSGLVIGATIAENPAVMNLLYPYRVNIGI